MAHSTSTRPLKIDASLLRLLTKVEAFAEILGRTLNAKHQVLSYEEDPLIRRLLRWIFCGARRVNRGC